MKESSRLRSVNGITLLEVAIVCIFILVIAAVLLPVFSRTHDNPRKSSCHNNLKELSTALQMYWNDYNGTFPSSALHSPKGTRGWDSMASAEFCSVKGQTPPKSTKPQDIHWVQLLWPHLKNKDIIWCPSDTDKSDDPNVLVSYFYRPAVDRAWFGVPTKNGIKYYRSEKDFDYVADQMIFFEHTGWHWGDQNKGWKDGVTFNAAFLDGHVRAVRLKDAVGWMPPKTAPEFAMRMPVPGEPFWFNKHEGSKTTKRTCWFDCGACYDDLP